MIKHFISKQFIVFLFTGGLAAIVNFTSRIVINRFTDYSIALVFAYLLGMMTAFVLAKVFVFKESQNTIMQSAMYFVLVNVVGIAQMWLISMWLAYYVLPYFGINLYVHEISHAIGIMVPAFTSYLGHKRLSFG